MVKTYPQNKPSFRNRLSRIGVVATLAVTLLTPFTLAASTPAGKLPPDYKPPEVVSSFSRGLQGLFGLNALAGWIGSRVLEKELRKDVQGPLDVKLKPFSALDLKAGKARHLRVKGHDLIYEKSVYISRFELETDESTPIWVDLDSGKFKSPLRAKVLLVLDETDANRSLGTPSVQKKLGEIKVPLLGVSSQTLRMVDPEVDFRDRRLGFKTLLGVAGAPDDKAIPLAVETGLTPQPPDNTRLVLEDLKIAPISGISNIAVVEKIVSKALAKFLNPSKLVPVDNSTFYIEQLTLTDNTMTVRGHVFIQPSA